MNQQNETIQTRETSIPPEKCGGIRNVETHFVLSVVAVCLSCFTGFFTIPLALAALILSLRVQDLCTQQREEEAQRIAFWAGFFGWLTVGLVVLPILLIVCFGSAILAALAVLLSAL